MARIFPIIVKKTIAGSSGGSTDVLSAVKVGVKDTVNAGSDVFTGTITGTYPDSLPTPTDTATVKVTFVDIATAPTDTKPVISIRYWATACTDNDSSKTVPANAQGNNNTTFANVTTNLALGDLTNPVILVSGAFTLPASPPLPVLGARLRVFYKQAAPVAALTDTPTLSYGGPLSGTIPLVAADFSTIGRTVDLSTLTFTQLASMNLTATYTATVVATPQTAIMVDAWCVEVDYQT